MAGLASWIDGLLDWLAEAMRYSFIKASKLGLK